MSSLLNEEPGAFYCRIAPASRLRRESCPRRRCARADVASRYSRGFCHITTRQNIQFHFVLLKNVEAAMRELAEEGLTTRETCGNSVRNITGCPYAGTSGSEIFDPSPS